MGGDRLVALLRHRSVEDLPDCVSFRSAEEKPEECFSRGRLQNRYLITIDWNLEGMLTVAVVDVGQKWLNEWGQDSYENPSREAKRF